jgi:hypothetical protein
LIIVGCTEDEVNVPQAKPIETQAEARQVYEHLKGVWEKGVKPEISTKESSTVSIKLTGTKGNAIATGRTTITNSKSSLSSYSSTLYDVTISYSGFEDQGFTSTGEIRFFESSSFESRCSSSGGCAYASKKSGSHKSASVEVQFLASSGPIADVIKIEAELTSIYSSWKIVVTTKSGKSFTF